MIVLFVCMPILPYVIHHAELKVFIQNWFCRFRFDVPPSFDGYDVGAPIQQGSRSPRLRHIQQIMDCPRLYNQAHAVDRIPHAEAIQEFQKFIARKRNGFPQYKMGKHDSIWFQLNCAHCCRMN